MQSEFAMTPEQEELLRLVLEELRGLREVIVTPSVVRFVEVTSRFDNVTERKG